MAHKGLLFLGAAGGEGGKGGRGGPGGRGGEGGFRGSCKLTRKERADVFEQVINILNGMHR